MTNALSQTPRLRVVAVVAAAALIVGACSDSDAGDAATSTTAKVPAVPETPELSDENVAALAETYEAFGNPDADVVIVNAQGGPLSELATDELREIAEGIDLDLTYVVNVHQSQTLDPDAFTASDIDFETAKDADAASVKMLGAVVDYFRNQRRRVYVVGISFGAFVLQDLIAAEGITADGYLIMVGRLDMPEAVWVPFSEGRAAGFVDGVDVVEFDIDEAGMGAPTPVGDRNMARLAAGLGHKRYTELLAGSDLSTVRYVYGTTDEQVGRLTETEIEFLEAHGADVTADPGGHGDAIDNHVVSELRALLDRSNVDDTATTDTGSIAAATVEFPSTTAPVGDALLTHSNIGGFETSDGTSLEFDQIEFVSDFDPALPEGVSGALPGPSLIAIAGDDTLMVIPIDLSTEEPAGEVLVLTPDGIFVADDVDFGETAEGFATATGQLMNFEDSSESVGFAATLGFGVGTSTFELDGDRAIVTGTLGARTLVQMAYLIDVHPEIRTLVLQSINGSEDDESNMQTGRLVREAGLNTLVRANGEIYSGGVDLFAAGVERVAEPGAVLGVHAWCCTDEGLGAETLEQNDPSHDEQLDYFIDMLGPERGPRFYFFTLQASPFEGIKEMTVTELDAFDLVTADNVLASIEAGDGTNITNPDPATSLTELADRIAADLATGEATAEVLVVVEAEPASALLSVFASGDDLSRGEIVFVSFELDDTSGWVVSGIERQAVCTRGVADGACI